MTLADVASELSEVLGRDITYVDVSHDAFIAKVRRSGPSSGSRGRRSWRWRSSRPPSRACEMPGHPEDRMRRLIRAIDDRDYEALEEPADRDFVDRAPG